MSMFDDAQWKGDAAMGRSDVERTQAELDRANLEVKRLKDKNRDLTAALHSQTSIEVDLRGNIDRLVKRILAARKVLKD